MQVADGFAFSEAFGKLCGAFNTPPTKPRREAYWQGFLSGSVAQFERQVNLAIEADLDDMPTVSQLRKLRPPSVPRIVTAAPQDSRDHLEFYANRLLLRHIGNRKGLGSVGTFVPGRPVIDCVASPELAACRDAVRALVAYFVEAVREGAEDATPEQFIASFIAAIGPVSQIAPQTLIAWSAQCEEPAAKIPFQAWMARQLPPAPAGMCA